MDTATNWPTHTLKTNWLVNFPTHNGRIYRQDVVEDAIKRYKEGVGNKGGWIVSGPDYGSVCGLEMMTHLTKDICIDEDGFVSATIKVLPTQYGQLLQAMLEFAPELLDLELYCEGTVGAGGIICNLKILNVCVTSTQT